MLLRQVPVPVTKQAYPGNSIFHALAHSAVPHSSQDKPIKTMFFMGKPPSSPHHGDNEMVLGSTSQGKGPSGTRGHILGWARCHNGGCISSFLSGAACTAQAAGPPAGEWLTRAVPWPGGRHGLWRFSLELPVPRAIGGRRHVGAWHGRASLVSVVPLG